MAEIRLELASNGEFGDSLELANMLNWLMSRVGQHFESADISTYSLLDIR